MESSVSMEDLWKLFQESNRIMQERHAETEKSLEQLSLKLAQVTSHLGNLGSRWGEFVEGLVAPACIRLFAERGVRVDELYSRVKKTVNGEHMEIDLLVANTIDAVVVEVKSHLTVEDVLHHLKQLNRFKTFFPRYASCRLFGAVAGVVIDSQADQFAINQGLFVIVQAGEGVVLANDPQFSPRVW